MVHTLPGVVTQNALVARSKVKALLVTVFAASRRPIPPPDDLKICSANKYSSTSTTNKGMWTEAGSTVQV